MSITFLLFCLSILLVWFKPVIVFDHKVTPWMVCFALSLISGALESLLSLVAVLEVGMFGLITFAMGKSEYKDKRYALLFFLVTIGSLLLAMHLLPGFHNPIMIKDMKFSTDAAPFTQYINYDKASVGIILLAFVCKKSRDLGQLKSSLSAGFLIAVATAATVVALASVIGFVKFDPKWLSYAPTFLVINLLFTCVAEEAFFRGLIQEFLLKTLKHVHWQEPIVVLLSGLFFGIAHLAGGINYVVLSTLTGLGCAIAYSRTKSIEASIIVHFSVNAVHFVGFTYPYLQ